MLSNFEEATGPSDGHEFQHCCIEDEEFTILRCTVPWDYQSEENRKTLELLPQAAFKLFGFQKAVRTFKWQRTDEALTGLWAVDPAAAKECVQKSGHAGVFLAHLSRNITIKPEITWVSRNDSEENADYMVRVAELCKNSGLQKPFPFDAQRNWALRGVPPTMAPGVVKVTWVRAGERPPCGTLEDYCHCSGGKDFFQL